ncbi:TATA-binding protein-associated factor 172 [Bicyclus anynana]|uniref:TATA-binding protein-associated factor 172 n=1 Tax=Bicyclus anynana TaxID=110368 RepID=A0ABM3LN29_BICAN|nr:TATA-binding protein-associated factor 172 [Bicyclus anynana]
MTSRLDRLFVLLEAGSGAATRRAAALQLGEVQRAHPEELHRLLARLMKHLRAAAWETRVAATQAVEAILSKVPEWHPPPFTAKEEELEQDDIGRLRCESFDIEQVLEHGAHLMGSEGHEYDLEEEALSATDMKDRLVRQRQQLNSRLGLDVASSLGVDISAVYSNEDLLPVRAAKTEGTRRPVQELMSKGLSSREMNLAKRKARAAFSKQKSRDCDDASAPHTPTTPTAPVSSAPPALVLAPLEPERKKIKLEPPDEQLPDMSCGGCAVPGRDGSWGEGARWPLHAWCGALQAQLVSAAWEARHGAASALRELLRAPLAASAGHRAGMTPQQMEDAHQEWLEDMALRLLCVLALDRFGDFVSDQVVAPVRETCAQTLGVALAQLRAARVRLVAERVATLARQAQWEARHGALLAFKYLLAARQELAVECGALEYLMAGLEDGAEDVSGVAAGALAPAAAALAAARPERLARLAARLWQLLRDQDDLATPANAYMALLAALMALPAAATKLHPIDLTDVLPRLWPYLDHSASSVRKATLQTLRTLTKPLVTSDINGKTNSNNNIESDTKVNSESEVMTNGEVSQYLMWTAELLQVTMRHIYQRVLFEHVPEIQEIAVQVWQNLLRHAPLGTILVAACPMLALWLCLAMQPARLPLEASLLLNPPPTEQKERRNRAGAGASAEAGVEGEPRPGQKWYLGGSESQPAALRDAAVTRARCLAAEILGYLSCYLVQPAPGIEYKAEDESPIDCYIKVMVVYLRSGSALQRLVASLVISSWARHTVQYGLYPPCIVTDNKIQQESDSKHTEEKKDEQPSELAKMVPPLLITTLHTSLNQSLYYDEVALNCNRILQEARDLLAMMKHYKLPVDSEEFNNIVRLEQVSAMTAATQPLVAAMKAKRAAPSLEERRAALHSAVANCTLEQATLNISVQAALSSAVAQLAALPERLNPVVRPLMESIKKEASEELQRASARTLAALLAQLVDRQSGPNNKVLVNLKAFLRCDPEYTPRISLENAQDANGDSGSGDSGAESKAETLSSHGPTLDKFDGIITLREQHRSAERVVPRRGRPPAHSQQQQHELSVELFPHEDEVSEYCIITTLREQHRSAERVVPRRGRPPAHSQQQQHELSVELFPHEDEVSEYCIITTLREQHRSAERVVPRRGRPPAHSQQQQHELSVELFPHEDEVSEYCIITTLREQHRSAERVVPRRGRPPAHSQQQQHELSVELFPHEDEVSEYCIITTLREQHRSAERVVPRRGRPPAHSQQQQHELSVELFPHEDEARKLLRIQRRGATMALTSLTEYFGDQLPEKLTKMWEFITQPFEKVMTDNELESLEEEAAEELISRLQVVEAVASSVGKGLWATLLGGISACAALTRAKYTALRHMAARGLAALAARDPHPVMDTLVHELIEALSEISNDRVRCGAAESLARMVDALQLQLVPYIVLLVVPLLGRMSDHNESVRMMSTRCFATLIQLMPLDGAVPEPAGLSQDMRERKARDKHFLEQLFNPKSIKDYKIPVPVSAELRSYQQAGVNWLRFLNEYKLHGVLCDDMGLGKTLQSIVVVAGSHYERKLRREPSMPSLVVCPPTLTGHWVFEVNKFISTKYLNPLQYVGPPAERERLRTHVHFYNLVVASYDIVRKDIDFFSSIKWNYCVLDEGHVIKNGKTKAFKAIKQIVANHRLILSGTPIQNNVLELWSLFDFLMPGLLGTERQFTARYSRPILAARDPRAPPHHLQAGALACEALHRQVLPFLLRRVKEDVLRELPPKITQDYYCELSPLQRRLYEHFSREHMPQDIESSRTHVFQALHYLQNVCNHPKLVLVAEHPEAARVAKQLAAHNSSLDDIEHGAKLPALKQLLLDCGIGTSPPAGDAVAVVSQHRALIFCQLKKMLDIVEKDLLQKHLPSVSYLRLDGSVPPHQRHSIVTRFNTDVSIDVLLLTTAVGGLGLNLTGADTVIFVEHDWNPMKDLQAMDRAHRIGQKRVVNVYRLITRDTLEEKIMGLQKFKLMTANTVISSENAAMETMGTDQLLDLFQTSPGPSTSSSQQQPPKSVINNLPDLWDDKQYEEEYDMSTFVKSLKKMKA